MGRRFRAEDPQISIFSSEVARISSELKTEVWTRRLALCPIPAKEFPEVAGLTDDYTGRLFDFVAIPVKAVSSEDIEAIVEGLRETKSVFTSIFGGEGELRLFAELVSETFSNLGSEACTRISFTLNEPLLTPYFPAASAPPNGVGVAASMLYVNDIRDALSSGRNLSDPIRESYERANALLQALSTGSNMRNYGVDLSISPWMDESVARLIEFMGKETFGESRSYDAVRELNGAISSVASASDVMAIGFNEVMLPYAEDSRLIELGGEGELTAYSLLSFAPICVAGLDMVVIPYQGKGELLRFLKDVYEVLSRKSRPAGIRVVPTYAGPGVKIKLGRFGQIPVLRLK